MCLAQLSSASGFKSCTFSWKGTHWIVDGGIQIGTTLPLSPTPHHFPTECSKPGEDNFLCSGPPPNSNIRGAVFRTTDVLWPDATNTGLTVTWAYLHSCTDRAATAAAVPGLCRQITRSASIRPRSPGVISHAGIMGFHGISQSPFNLVSTSYTFYGRRLVQLQKFPPNLHALVRAQREKPPRQGRSRSQGTKSDTMPLLGDLRQE